jgi:hypothetical protein
MTETDPVSETSCFLVSRIPEYGKSPKSSNSEILGYLNTGNGHFLPYHFQSTIHNPTNQLHVTYAGEKPSSFYHRILRSSVFWNIKPCSSVRVNRRLGGTYRLHFQGQETSKKQAIVRISNPGKESIYGLVFSTDTYKL